VVQFCFPPTHPRRQPPRVLHAAPWAKTYPAYGPAAPAALAHQIPRTGPKRPAWRRGVGLAGGLAPDRVRDRDIADIDRGGRGGVVVVAPQAVAHQLPAALQQDDPRRAACPREGVQVVEVERAGELGGDAAVGVFPQSRAQIGKGGREEGWYSRVTYQQRGEPVDHDGSSVVPPAGLDAGEYGGGGRSVRRLQGVKGFFGRVDEDYHGAMRRVREAG
jgi:hypothetical protein